jgi:ribosomal protein S18 acetylase RimI-like enzyme
MEDVEVLTGVTGADLPAVAAALSDAFAGYPVALAFTAESLRAMVAEDDVVPAISQLARDRRGRIAGVGLAALRGRRGRIAAMGVTRSRHRNGVGQAIGEALLAALARAGATDVVLEALTVNAPALALYEGRLGFARRRRLVGFGRAAGGPAIAAQAWDEALRAGWEADSWQLAAVARRAREREDLVSVPAVVPEQHPVAGLLRDAGFRETAIAQYELRRVFPSRARPGLAG